MTASGFRICHTVSVSNLCWRVGRNDLIMTFFPVCCTSTIYSMKLIVQHFGDEVSQRILPNTCSGTIKPECPVKRSVQIGLDRWLLGPTGDYYDTVGNNSHLLVKLCSDWVLTLTIMSHHKRVCIYMASVAPPMGSYSVWKYYGFAAKMRWTIAWETSIWSVHVKYTHALSSHAAHTHANTHSLICSRGAALSGCICLGMICLFGSWHPDEQ